MKTKFKGIIIFCKRIKDNDLYIKILSSEDLVNSGIVYGGNSSKKKITYQTGYFIDYIITQKNQNSIAIIVGEIREPFLSYIYEDKYKLNALLSIVGLINSSILEGQKIQGFYNDIECLINIIINKKHWIISYLKWLFILLQKIGYQIDYKNNKEFLYYDVLKQEFSYNLKGNCIKFPHNLFTVNPVINFQNINAVFIIFERIYLKNHLDNIGYKMPVNYINFKKMIIQKLES